MVAVSPKMVASSEITISSTHNNKHNAAHALGAVPVVFVVQRPGSFAAEHIVLLDARHIVAQKDEQYPATAADQNTDQAAAFRNQAEHAQLRKPAHS